MRIKFIRYAWLPQGSEYWFYKTVGNRLGWPGRVNSRLGLYSRIPLVKIGVN